MRLVVSLLALLAIGGLAPAGALAVPIAPVPALQELIVMNTPAAPTATKKTRAAKAAEKAADTPAAVADTDNRSEEQTGSVDGNLPSTDRGEIAATNSEGQPTAPAHSDGTDAVAQQAQPEPIAGAQEPDGESTAFAIPATETGEAEEADAAAASSADTQALYERVAALSAERAPLLPSGKSLRLVEAAPDHIFEGVLVVTGPPDGFRRAGHRFGPEPTILRAEELTREQLGSLYAEPLLSIRSS